MWSEEDSKEEHGEDDEWVETQKLNTTFVNSVDDTYWNSPVEHTDPAGGENGECYLTQFPELATLDPSLPF